MQLDIDDVTTKVTVITHSTNNLSTRRKVPSSDASTDSLRSGF